MERISNDLCSADLNALFKPKTIALVGASERKGYASTVFKNLTRLGFPVENLFLVNQNRKQLFGVDCYPSLAEIPQSVGLAVIATPTQSVPDVLRQCAARNVRAAIVFADGFAEAGEAGRQLQHEISDIVRTHRILLCGPNCMGLAVPRERLGLWATPLPDNFRSGNISALFQSSGVLNLFFGLLSARGLGFRIAVSTGNQAGLKLEDYLAYAIEDPETQVVLLFVEALNNGKTLAAVLDRAAELRKPIIALRAGKSEKSQKNVTAHTGNLASAGAAWDALLRQKGVILLDNFDQLVEATVLFSIVRPPDSLTGTGAGLITISGGDCSFLADVCERVGIELPQLGSEAYQQISQNLGKTTLLGNPLDIEGLRRENEDSFYQCVEAFIGDSALNVIGCRLNLSPEPTEDLQKAYRRIAALAQKYGKYLIFFSRASEFVSSRWFDFFNSLETPFLQEYEKGLKAVHAWIRYVKFIQRKKDSLLRNRNPEGTSPILESSRGPLSYKQAAELLSVYNIPLVAGEIANTATAAQEIAARIGFPVALKVIAAQIAHKTDIGAVTLNVKTAEEVAERFSEIIDAAKKGCPDAIIEGVLVQSMVNGVAEVILGIHNDAQVGPAVVFGLGGVLVEALKDVAIRVAPIDLDDAFEMIHEIRGKDLLRGFRGKPRGDLHALAQAIVSLSKLAWDLKDELQELDINPMIVLPDGKGVCAVDILAVRKN